MSLEIISDKDVKIRKPHRCLMCCRKFDIGTIMNCQVNKLDDIQSVYTCMACQSLMAYIEPNDENMYESECLTQAKYNDNFGGTPEEYLQYKIKQNADRIELQRTCVHNKVSRDWQQRNYNRCDNCQKLIRIL